jgi:CheY-like chemotaxis protein
VELRRIFMGLRMPIMDGEQASAIIKSRRGLSAPVIIAITASVFRDNLATDNPFDCFISKPFLINPFL